MLEARRKPAVMNLVERTLEYAPLRTRSRKMTKSESRKLKTLEKCGHLMLYQKS